MTGESAYNPLRPARRPGSKPQQAPIYRVLVHRSFYGHYNELVVRVGEQQAKQFWDHVAHQPGSPDPIAQTTILKGRAGKPRGPGWSRTFHYELSSSARVDYQYHDAYATRADGDPHKVVAILTINYSSH